MATTERGVEFCEGCPSQGGFVGTVTEKLAEIDVKIPSFLDSRGNAGQSIRSVTKFVDSDGGESDAFYHGVSEYEQHNYEIEDRYKGALSPSQQKAVAKIETETVKEALPSIVERIGRCAHAGANTSDERYCPALKYDVLRKMIKPIPPTEIKKAV